MVSLADAGSNPRTVMVMNGDAAVTNTAVVNSWCLNYLAGWALFALDLILVLVFAFVFINSS